MAGYEDEQSLSCLTPLFVKYGVQKAVLFGSFARGTASRRSDIDLMLIVPTEKRFFDRYDEIQVEIVDLLKGRFVDILIYTPIELEAMAHRKFIQTILREGVVVYEQGACAS